MSLSAFIAHKLLNPKSKPKPKVKLPVPPGLNPAQIEAITADYRRILVTSCPGSGKTKVLTERILRLLSLGVPPESILAITFTVEAARTMSARLKDSVRGVTLCTFHSLAYKMLRTFGTKIGLPEDFKVLDAKESLEVLSKIRVYEPFIPQHQQSAISYSKAKQVVPTNPLTKAVYLEYTKLMNEEGWLDFDDLLDRAIDLLKLPEPRAWYQDRYTHILVDEMQDSNRAQITMLNELLSPNNNLFVVGDQMQSIYGWRAAEPKYVTDFQSNFEHSKVIALNTNYRSTQGILDAAYALIKNDPDCMIGRMVAARGPGPQPELAFCWSQDDEAKYVAKVIASLIKQGTAPGDIAVLYRINNLLWPIQKQLRLAKVPFGLKDSNVIDPALRPLIALMSAAAGESPAKAKTWCKANLKDGPTLDELIARTKDLRAGPAMELILTETRYREWIKQVTTEQYDRLIDELSALQDLANDYADTIDDFLKLVKSGGARTLINNSVTLSTIHAAKGLEWKVVFLIGLEEGILPHKLSFRIADQLEEERRLLYVAMTRAADRLYMTCCTRRKTSTGLSRFAKEFSRLCDVKNEPKKEVSRGTKYKRRW